MKTSAQRWYLNKNSDKWKMEKKKEGMPDGTDSGFIVFNKILYGDTFSILHHFVTIDWFFTFQSVFPK